ncbi:MAG: hypothetical protein AAFQ66_17700 [Pseudomonadota bacterium]
MNIQRLFAMTTIAALATTAAMADTTSVNCTGYVVAISDSVAVQGEAMAGTQREFEDMVCSRSAELAGGVEDGTIATIPVFVEELGVSTRVVIFKSE